MNARGFEPKAGAAAKVLVLGTLPGEESLRRGEYYAHPRNVFWRIVESLFGIPASEPYADRVRKLNEAGVALWDVCAAATRPAAVKCVELPSTSPALAAMPFEEKLKRWAVIRQACET